MHTIEFLDRPFVEPAGSEQNVPIRQSMKKRFFYSVLLITGFLLTTGTGLSGAQVINCSSGFNTTTTGNSGCGVSPYNQYAEFMIENQPTTILRGTAAVLEPSGAPHNSYSLIKQVPVNDQAFTATYTFVPNGLNLAFVVENNHNSYSSSPSYPFSAYVFQAGAGAEGGFSQSAGGGNYPPDHVFALELDSAQGMNNSYGAFSHSNIQLFQTLQSPIRPMCCTGYLPEYETDTLSTSPVSLNSPVSAAGTTTGDTYSATVTYNHGTGTLVYSLFDVTTGGSCPGASCFTHTWTNVWIPEIVGSTTAYVGLTAGSSGYNGGSATDLLIRSLTYTVNTPSGTPAYTAWNANSTYNIGTPSAASPVYSVAPGTYGAAQTVAISTSTGPHNYICYVLSPSTPTLYPQPDNNGGCAAGTLYTGPITISNTATLYAMAGSNNSAFPIAAQEPPGLGPPSTLVAGTYTIGAGSSIAATPSFSPPGGTFTATQSVALADASPGVILCYNTTGNPSTNGSTGCVTGSLYGTPITVSASEKIYAVAGGSGYIDSPVAISSYVIQAQPSTPVATTTILTAPTNHLINGQQASITAAVAPASGALPTGNVSFYAAGQLLGVSPLSNGQATLVAALSTRPGSFEVTATYNGSALNNKSSSAPLTFTVVSTTASELTSSATQVVEGSPVVLSAAVASNFGGGTPTGAIAFYIGTTALGTQQLSGGKATDNAQINLPPGQYPITAVYTGDANDESSTSNALTLTVNAPVVPQVSTNTALTITPSTPTAGQTMQLSSLVTAASGSTPSGVVNFFLGQVQIGSTTLTSGAAKISMSAPSTSGSYQLTAVYAGTSQDSASSSAPVTITIAPSVVATSTSLVSSVQQVSQGQLFALSAKVTAQNSSSVNGSVNFFLGQTQLGSAALISGQANWSGSAAFAPGQYPITAVYTGDTTDGSSTSNSLTLIVNATVTPETTTNTVLTVTPSTPAAGQSMQLSSLVTAASGAAPSGVVNFFVGQTQVASASLLSGAAGVSINAPSISGSYQLTAVYAGNSNDSASSSAPVTITIAPNVAATTTSLSASAQQVPEGQAFALTAAVTSSGASSPTGMVNFFLGQTLLGSSALTSGQASWTGPATMAPGPYQVTATYSGDSQDNGSSSSGVALTILPDAAAQTFNTTTALTFSPQQIAAGQNVNISIQVAEQGGTSTPSGSVAVYMGQTQLGTTMLTNGSASLSMEAPAPGTYTLTAAYMGAGQDLSSQSSPVIFVVNVAASTVPVTPVAPSNPTFTLGLSNSSITVAEGQSASLQVLLSAGQGYQGAVQLSCAGLPAGVACNFSPATVSLQAASADSTLSISSNSTAVSSKAMETNATFAILGPWNLVGLLGMCSRKRRRKSGPGTMVLLLFAAGAGLIALTGCGVHVNNVTQPYQVSVTAVGANQQSQTQTFTLNVNGPAAIF